MKRPMLATIVVALCSFTLLTGFGLKDLKDEIKPNTKKCEGKKNESECKNKELLKSGAKVVAIGIAAKLAYDMIVEYTSANVQGYESVVKEYLEKNDSLPAQPTVVSYSSSLQPGSVIKTGDKITVATKLAVVPGKKVKDVLIEEKIEIYDNEDTSKVIKSLVKAVNADSKRGGAFENQFSFTLPEGMPQGVYPVKTAAIVNGKENPATENNMQVVMHVLPNQQIFFAYAQ